MIFLMNKQDALAVFLSLFAYVTYYGYMVENSKKPQTLGDGGSNSHP